MTRSHADGPTLREGKSSYPRWSSLAAKSLLISALASVICLAISPASYAADFTWGMEARGGTELDTNPQRLETGTGAHFGLRGSLMARYMLEGDDVNLSHQALALSKYLFDIDNADSTTLDHTIRVGTWMGDIGAASMSLRHIERHEARVMEPFRLLQPGLAMSFWLGEAIELNIRGQWNELWWLRDKRLNSRGPQVSLRTTADLLDNLRWSLDLSLGSRSVYNLWLDTGRPIDRLLSVRTSAQWRPGLHLIEAGLDHSWQDSTSRPRSFRRLSLNAAWTAAIADGWFVRGATTLRWLSYLEGRLVEDGVFIEDDNRTTVHAALSGPITSESLSWELRYTSSLLPSSPGSSQGRGRHELGAMLLWRAAN